MSFFKNKLEIIFFSLIFYGLSFSLIIKELLNIYNPFYEFLVLEIYRFLIISICITCLILGREKLNKFIFFLIILHLLFLYSSYFGEKIEFIVEAKSFYLNDKTDQFFYQKNKVILINILNIILPLISLSFLETSNKILNEFKNFSVSICDIMLILLAFILSFNYFSSIITYKYSIENLLMNLHGTIYFLNIYFLIIIEKIFVKKEINFLILIKIILIFYCFFIVESVLHPMICFFTFIVYLALSKHNKFIIILFTFCFFIIFLSNILKLSNFDFEITMNHIIYYDTPGTLIYSLISRFKHIEFFIFLSDNQNFLFGNNIFTDNIYTYPHNLLIDIFVTTGVIGLIIFIYIIIYLIKFTKKYIDNNNLFIILIFFQSFIFSIFSGFFFTNIILNISLAACFCFLKPKHSIIP